MKIEDKISFSKFKWQECQMCDSTNITLVSKGGVTVGCRCNDCHYFDLEEEDED